MKKTFVLVAALLALASCQPTPDFKAHPLQFTSKPPLRINVAQIRVIDTYQPSLRAPSVDHDFPTPPATAVHQWVSQRLLASGAQGVLEVEIVDASVSETALPRTKGIKGVFTDDQSQRYDAKLHVTLRLYSGAQAISDAEGSVSVTRSRTLNEDASVADRERLYHEMTQDMMAQFDSEAELRLRQYFARFLL